MMARKKTETAPLIEEETANEEVRLERWSTGVGIRNCWTVFDIPADEYAGTIWVDGRRWFAQRYDGYPATRHDTASEAISALTRRVVLLEKLAGLDLVVR